MGSGAFCFEAEASTKNAANGRAASPALPLIRESCGCREAGWSSMPHPSRLMGVASRPKLVRDYLPRPENEYIPPGVRLVNQSGVWKWNNNNLSAGFVRYDHPPGGIVVPAVFVQLANDSQRVVACGGVMWEKRTLHVAMLVVRVSGGSSWNSRKGAVLHL